jgi:hypothetical protein
LAKLIKAYLETGAVKIYQLDYAVVVREGLTLEEDEELFLRTASGGERRRVESPQPAQSRPQADGPAAKVVCVSVEEGEAEAFREALPYLVAIFREVGVEGVRKLAEKARVVLHLLA